MVLNAVLLAAGVLYVIATALLFAFGANLTRFSLIEWRNRRQPVFAMGELAAPQYWPTVTVQLPIYNELYVAKRIIDAAVAIDYPADRLEIQVLDDSTDETSEIIAEIVDAARARSIDIVHIRRASRPGYKAGALAAGLRCAKGEFVAIFDADFVPPANFLRRTIPHFGDTSIAFVQTRWGHINDDYSALTRLQSLTIDAHFMVEQAARARLGYWFNFNGTCGVWRATAIHDAGGWTAETLTEDLDLSYRAHLRGWRAAYLPDVVVPGELPAQMSGFRRQQHRWARGSIECALKLLKPVWRSGATPSVKLQATAHLTGYAVHLLLLMLTLLYPLVVIASVRHPQVRTLFGLAFPLALASLAPALFLVTGQQRLGRNWVRQLPRVLAIITLGSGLMLNTARAAFQIHSRPNPEFERTAKFGLANVNGGELRKPLLYRLDFDGIVLAEFTVGVYSLISAWMAFRYEIWGIALYASVFGTGLLAVVAMTLSQDVSARRSRPAAGPRAADDDVGVAFSRVGGFH